MWCIKRSWVIWCQAHPRSSVKQIASHRAPINLQPPMLRLLLPLGDCNLFSSSIRSRHHLYRISSASHKRTTSSWPYIYTSKPLSMAPQLDAYFKQVDTLAESFIDRLRSAVAIPSISAEDERRKDVVRVRLLPHHAPPKNTSNTYVL